MILFNNNADKLNELVFENRNKSYGAYAIRMAYSNTLIKSCLIVFSTIAVLLGTAVMASEPAENITIIEAHRNNDPLIDTISVDLSEMEKPVEKHEPVETTPASAAPNTAIATVVSETAAVAEHSVDVDNPTSGQGDPSATGTSLTSTVTTSNTLTATESTLTATGSSTTEVVIAEEMPEFAGGIKGLIRFISENIEYPEQARAIGQEGTVHVTFVVDEFGYVTGVKVIKGIGYGCDEEAARVISKIPKWIKPGKNGGHPVRVRFNLPVSFRLR